MLAWRLQPSVRKRRALVGNCSSPGLLWTHSGLHRDTRSHHLNQNSGGTSNLGQLARHRCLCELPPSRLTAINVPEPLALGLIDCLFEKVDILARWQRPPAHNLFTAHPLQKDRKRERVALI